MFHNLASRLELHTFTEAPLHSESYLDTARMQLGLIQQSVRDQGNGDAQLRALRVLGLLLTAEPVLHTHLDPRVAVRPHLGETLDGYFAWRDAYDAKPVLAQVGLTVRDLAGWHEWLMNQILMIDPVADFRVVLRHVRREQRDRMRGAALLANDLYDAAEGARRYLGRFHGVLLLDEDAFYGRESERTKERLYGASHTTDFDRRVFRRITRDFDLDPQARVTLFVEGDTELGFYKRLADLLHINLERSGIDLMNLNGLGGLKSDRLRELLDRLQREEVFVYVVIDHDQGGDHLRDLKAYARQGRVTAGFRVWEPDFEEANFSVAELAELASTAARRGGVEFTISPGELEEASRYVPVGTAIERLSRRHKFFGGKGVAWGELLAERAFNHPEPPHLPGEQTRPAVMVLKRLLRGQRSSYHFSTQLERVDDDGTLKPRRERRTKVRGAAPDGRSGGSLAGTGSA